MTLDKIGINQQVKILSLNIQDNTLKKRLEELGFVMGTKIKKVYIAPFNDPIIINIRNYNIALSSNIVEKIEVI